jgi:ABC-type glycerol-3-phosphate transport system permease component
VLVVIILLRAIWDFKEFDLIFLLTGGGPISDTQTLPLLVYQEAFALNHMGMASAYAVVMMLIMLVFMIVYIRRTRSEEDADVVVRKFAFNIFAWAIVLAVAFPLFWMLVTSVKPGFELFRRPPTMLPETWTLEHYWHLIERTNFLIYFRNSVVLSTVTTLVVVAIGTLGAYSLVRFKFRGRESLAFLVLFTYLLPSVVLIIPLYLLLVNLGLSNTIFSLVIAYTTFALPYALWLLRSFMAGIPEDLKALHWSTAHRGWVRSGT